jgi:hypothetical protein
MISPTIPFAPRRLLGHTDTCLCERETHPAFQGTRLCTGYPRTCDGNHVRVTLVPAIETMPLRYGLLKPAFQSHGPSKATKPYTAHQIQPKKQDHYAQGKFKESSMCPSLLGICPSFHGREIRWNTQQAKRVPFSGSSTLLWREYLVW